MDSLLRDLDSYKDVWGGYMDEIDQGLQNLQTLKSEIYNVYADNGIGVVIMHKDMPEIPGPVLHREFGFSVDRYLLIRNERPNTDKFRYKYLMNGHGWAPTVQRYNLKKPYVEKLMLRLKEFTGVKWVKAEGLTGLVQSEGVVDMDPEDVVEVFVESDSTLRTLAVLDRTLEAMDDPTKQSKDDDVLSGDKLKRAKKKVRY
mmetsp:Transcript_7948/g.11273  ORF Transcript_7948/g.11273 Transcript_7948/m.11273 type:complete len:201 (+) Transcript_7948:1-603(+)